MNKITKGLGALVLASAIGSAGCEGNNPQGPDPVTVKPTPALPVDVLPAGNYLEVTVNTTSISPESGSVIQNYGDSIDIRFDISVWTNREDWASTCGLKRDDGRYLLMLTNNHIMRGEFKNNWKCFYWLFPAGFNSMDPAAQWSRGHKVRPFVAIGDINMNSNPRIEYVEGINMDHVDLFKDFGVEYEVRW